MLEHLLGGLHFIALWLFAAWFQAAFLCLVLMMGGEETFFCALISARLDGQGATFLQQKQQGR